MTKIFLKSLLILSFINLISGCDDSKWLKQNDLNEKEAEFVPAPGSNWIPSKYIEEQSGKVTYNLATASELLNTTAEPYSKDSRLIFLYKQESNGNSILLTVTRGLAICPETDCDVIFKFDEERPVKVKMFVLNDFDGHSFQIRSAQDKEEIIKLLKKSKQLKVDISLINNGIKTAQFDISNFNFVLERFLKENSVTN
ncbi:hypothetical protein [Acinetobacter baumannii]|uniref:hypothetical protein n=1 Tax=Acinetobacter baumannii TaxID=470 RepID=UPI0021BED818|nr:hypothetical protein [Acinetobacter baumannii]MCT9176614.1 hypothetical protein [Acinetobacter baumannii]MDA5807214.1 hypothetical protein [Acinetobacter baumannii]